MRVSPKYIIQLCQKGTKLHKRSHKYKKKQKKYCMYSRYTSCKRVPKKRTKKRQTQIKRQGSSETSRIKLEIVETSRIKLETVETSRKNWKLIKHLAFQTEKTHRRERPQQLVAQIRGKVISLKVRKQVIRSKENSDTMSTTSRTNRAPSDSNCIEIHAKQAFQ